IKYSFYILSATFLFAFLLTVNSPLMSQPQSLAYATSQQEQEPDQQQDVQITSDTQESETNTGSINSEQTEVSGEDYNNNENLIGSEVGCSAVATNDPNYVYCNTQQQSIQPQQQTSQQPPQQNVQSNPSQTTFANPRIDSDTSISNVPNTETTTTTTQKSFNPIGQYKPGSGQTELSTLGKSDGLARPYTPGGANDRVVGIPSQPNTNPQTPIDPGNIPTTIPDKAYLTVITKMMNFYTGFLKVSDFEICVKTTIQTDGKFRDVDAIPRCANGSSSGFQYTVQAPGSITIWVNNLDELGVKSVIVETPNLSNHIDAFETKSSTIYISPYSSQ
ncbi:MAG TPA: hypothetical protein VFT71_02855, partial [Candidatus Nitrosocosmicus sp.]|nr:hypothetical protein [Candidatus Nitrosocosmicus sp.]